MDTPPRILQVLVIEDSAEDALLLRRELEKGGFALECTRVETGPALEARLNEGPYDLVLADYSLPGFDGLAALKAVRARCPDTPFIIVSGTISDAMAVETMRAGAQDYILKNNLTRLAPAVRRELHDAEERMARRRAERAAQESEARLKLILDSIQAGILVLEPAALRVVDANPAALALLGDSRSHVVGTSCEQWIRPVESGQPHITDPRQSGCLAEYLLLRSSQERLTILAQPVWAGVGEQQQLLVSFIDVTERKRLEESLRQSQKMDAMGQLAGGMAHGFNNLLMAILGRCELLLEGLPPEDPRRHDVELIQKAGTRAAEMTRQLLAFSRRATRLVKVFDLNAVLATLEPALRQCLGDSLMIILRPAKQPVYVSADPGQVEQVVMSLALNAREAMPQGGRLSVETASVELAESAPERPKALPPGRYAKVVVADTGVGMGPEVQARLFEAFFSTKGRGRGAGLGLFTVHEIVRQSRGEILVSSVPGKGTSFTIYLPQAGLPAAQPPAEPRQTVSVGAETILLAEDDEDVRELLAEVLRLSGYTVLTATSVREAIILAQGHGGPIHLLVSDVVLQRQSGPELAKQLASLRPDMRVMYISGYGETILAKYLQPDTQILFLQKPFSAERLRRAVREALDRPAPK